MIRALATAATLLAPGTAFSFEPAFDVPAEPTARIAPRLDSYLLPTAAFHDGAMVGRVVEGAVERRAWRVAAPAASTLELMAPLRAQLVAQGYEVVFECATDTCGGFDFRFSLDLLPEPDMHVDLGDFRFLSAERSAGDAVGLVVSRSARAGFVQVTSVSPAAFPATPAAIPDRPAPAAPGAPPSPGAPGEAVGIAPDIGAALRADGRVVLSDLIFATGSADLVLGDFATLAALADWMNGNPQARIVLVGHTDASGGLAANIDLSRRRAEAVRRQLIDTYDVPTNRLSAEGVGYLAPQGSNATEEGRALNRRVEAVLLAD